MRPMPSTSAQQFRQAVLSIDPTNAAARAALKQMGAGG